MKQELFDIDFTSSGLHYLICLSVVAGVEGLSYKEHEAKSYWHAVHSFGWLPYRRLGLISCLIFSFCRATLKLILIATKGHKKKELQTGCHNGL